MKKNQVVLLFLVFIAFGCSKEYAPVDFPAIGAVNKVADTNPRSFFFKCMFEGEFDKLNYKLEGVGFCYSLDNPEPTIQDDILPGTIANDNASFTGIGNDLPHSKKVFIRGYLDLGTAIIYSSVLEQAALPAGFITLKNLASFTDRRTEAVAFSIGNKGYVGTGSYNSYPTPLDDFWEYTPETNTWAQIASTPTKISSACAFVIKNKAYVCGGSRSASGSGSSSPINFFASYDPLKNTWEELANIPKETAGAIGFSIDQKGYVVGGIDQELRPLNEVWMYDPIIDTWEAKNPAPAALTAVSGVVHKKIAYIGPSYNTPNTFLSYEPASDHWTFLPEIPGVGGGDYLSFVYKDRIYAGFGIPPSTSDIVPNKPIWQYNLETKEWLSFDKFSGNSIDPHFSEGITFTIQDRVFIGTGQTESSYTNLFFELIFEE